MLLYFLCQRQEHKAGRQWLTTRRWPLQAPGRPSSPLWQLQLCHNLPATRKPMVTFAFRPPGPHLRFALIHVLQQRREKVPFLAQQQQYVSHHTTSKTHRIHGKRTDKKQQNFCVHKCTAHVCSSNRKKINQPALGITVSVSTCSGGRKSCMKITNNPPHLYLQKSKII